MEKCPVSLGLTSGHVEAPTSIHWTARYVLAWREVVCTYWYNNLATLKVSIVKASQQILLKTIRESIDYWLRRHGEYVRAKGSHFE